MNTERSIKFLLVDDLEANLVALEALLKRERLEILRARSGAEALELLLIHDVALALIDVQMPEMGGFELAELMRGAERTRGVPIIFLTAGTVDQDRRIRGYEMGAVDFLPKPIDAGNLLTKAATFFELGLQREKLRESEVRLRSVNEELAQRNAELAQADRHKDQFLAVLAHELRNPLAPILMGLDVIGSTPGCPESITGLARTMRRQMGQMVHLIDDLLDVSRINTGKIELKIDRVDLSPIIDKAVETAVPRIERQGHELIIDKGAVPLFLEADRHRLSQVISNLLTNAAKYTPPNGRIELTVCIEGRMAMISVKDNGEGISAESQERIFGMFEQLDNSRQEGLGIGLSLVRNLVELHGGRISVASPGLGKGSVFTISIPLASAPPPTDTPAEPDTLPEVPEPVPSARVMVVDDGRSTADILALFLKMEGMETRTAYNGRDAVRLAGDFKPRLIFMDIGMPEMDGYETAGAIRQFDRDVILVAVSGWDRPEDRKRSAEAGFDGHAAKPVTPDKLREFLRLLGGTG